MKRGRHRFVQGVVIASAALVVAGVAVAALDLGLLDRPSSAQTSRSHTASLTTQQFAQAVAAAHWAQSEYSESVTGAMAITRDGVVMQSNIGTECTSGRLVEVTLYGSFPHVATSGRFDPDGDGIDHEDQVSSVTITLDGTSGQRCLISVTTGPPTAEQGSELLFGKAP